VEPPTPSVTGGETWASVFGYCGKCGRRLVAARTADGPWFYGCRACHPSEPTSELVERAKSVQRRLWATMEAEQERWLRGAAFRAIARAWYVNGGPYWLRRPRRWARAYRWALRLLGVDVALAVALAVARWWLG